MTDYLDLRHVGRRRPHCDDVDQAAYHHRYQNDVLAANLQAEDDKLADAQAQAVLGPIGGYATPPAPPSIPEHLRDDARNQHWRNSVGDPSAIGTSAAADDPTVQLVSQKMTSPRPREPKVNAPVGRRHLEGKAHPITSTRLRPSDLGEDY